jgi:UDP-N-acetylmuramate: L-alanyl-gamma-D-glutamyl-meso-diaminopimelate ligase
VWNVTAGIILARELGLPDQAVAQALETFSGVERRLTTLARLQNTVFIEDFAHHPTAVSQVLGGLRADFPGQRIVALFEPRSWSLRRNFFQGRLAASLCHADEIVIKDIFEKEKIPPGERLDIGALRAELEAQGKTVRVFSDYEEIKRFVGALDFSLAQVVILLSNGDVGDFTAWVKGLEAKAAT